MAEEVIKIVGTADMSSLNKGLDTSKGKLDSFGKSVDKTSTGLKAAVPGTNQAAFALQNLGRVAQDAPFGFIGIGNNINPLLESFQRLKVETGSTGGALKALAGSLTGAAGIGLAVSVATGLLTVFAQNGLFKSGKEADDASKKLEKYKEAVNSIFASAGKEAAETLSLVAVLKNENETRQRKLESLEELKKINPIIFGQLKLEQGAVIGLDNAYKDYIANFKNIIAAKILQAKVEAKVTQILEKQGSTQSTLARNFKAGFKEQLLKSAAAGSLAAQQQLDKLSLSENKTAKETSFLSFELENLVKQLSEFSSAVKTKPIKDIELKAKKIKIDGTSAEVSLGEETLKKQIKFGPEQKVSLAVDVEVAPKIKNKGFFQQVIQDEIERARLAAEQRLIEFNNFIAQSTEAIIEGSLFNLGDAIGNALTGKGDGLNGLFDSIFSSVGSQIQQLGKFLIETGLKIAAAKKAFAKLLANPLASIAVGVGLVALGAVLKSVVGKKPQGFATGTRNFSGGTAIVGERGPELIGLPRGASVTPNAQSNAILNGAGGGGFVASYVLRGQDLITVINRTNQSNNRAGFN